MAQLSGFMTHTRRSFLPLAALILLTAVPMPVHAAGPAPDPAVTARYGSRPMLIGNLDRPLRYTPDGGDFVIRDGGESFNRPLYGGPSAFRVDGGDRPEFSVYLPGRGGVLRFALATPQGIRWLHASAEVVIRYRAGALLHEVRDPVLGDGVIRLHAVAEAGAESLLVRLDTSGIPEGVDLIAVYGGITGERGGRDGDIGTERVPVSEYFRPQSAFAVGNEIALVPEGFAVAAKGWRVGVVCPEGARFAVADAAAFDDPARLTQAASPTGPHIGSARVRLPRQGSLLLGLEVLGAPGPEGEVLEIYRKVAAETGRGSAARTAGAPLNRENLPARFAATEERRRILAERVVASTPDPFLNAAFPALNVAADAVWDERQGGFLHGGVAWRVRLLGWRVAYAGDVLGWHGRTRTHFDTYAERQNTGEIPDRLPEPEATANLARNENALHSNGDLTRSHYDMNLVGVDTFFRHLQWTGDLDYARRRWPVIERHLAWQSRLFRRTFPPGHLPLYEAYACIWASDDLAYNGGGSTHSSAYNLFHRRMAARVARLIGEDPVPHEREAERLEKGIDDLLWLPRLGWYAEAKDLLGLQRVRPEAAAWTYYHTLDSGVPDALRAWQMTRAIETRLPRIPVRGPGVPAGTHTIATTRWMPYTWSLNNVVLAESVHTALALWQAGRADQAYPLLKGALLDSMYLGICPGNVGMCTWYDANRRESQRDFGDGVGILARALVEGLFGVAPDLLEGTFAFRPGFPDDWNHASLGHPEFRVAFAREGGRDRYEVAPAFGRPLALALEVPARRVGIGRVTVNGAPAAWQAVPDAVGRPRIRVLAPAQARFEVDIEWAGDAPVEPPAEVRVQRRSTLTLDTGAAVVGREDPQGVVAGAVVEGRVVKGTAVGQDGHRTLFARVRQGEFSWRMPLAVEIRPPEPEPPQVFTTAWRLGVGARKEHRPVSLAGIHDARITDLFRQEYLAPRSPYVSLATPKQGFGSWCKPTATFEVDDSGLRALAAGGGGRILLPNGAPLVTPADAESPNIAFVSRWQNYPQELTVPLAGRASRLYLLMAGTTRAMESRIDNGEILVAYADGTRQRLALENPTTWWPIDQDYFIDDFAFARPGPLPLRIDLQTGKMRILDEATFKGAGRRVPGGAATVLDLSLDPSRELRSLTVRALSNEVVIGLMSATLER
jgi:hypothetical protein